MPPGFELVALAVVMGVPRFLNVLEAILEEVEVEVEVEGAIIEAEAESSPAGELLSRQFPDAEVAHHDELKKVTRQARCAVRTEETMPYANLILGRGVPF